MPTIQIQKDDTPKAGSILRKVGAGYSRFPRNYYVVTEEHLQALKAGGVRLWRRDPRSVRPPWLAPQTGKSTNSRKELTPAR